MDLAEFGPDDTEDVGAYADVLAASFVVDCAWLPTPTPFRTEMEMRHGWDGELGRYFLGRDGGEVVAAANLSTSEYDNHDLAWLELSVRPDHRRRGYGRGLLGGLVQQAHEMGRPLVGVSGWDAAPVRAFAAAEEYPLVAQDIARRLEVPADLAPIRAVRDEAISAARDYELLRLDGPTPEEMLAGVAEMTGAINDAPTDDMEYEDEYYPPERIRAYEEHSIAGGHRFYRLVARRRSDGALAGHTVVQVDTDLPTSAHQHDTSVVAAHRGHRLGLLLKAEMVLWLAEVEPQLRNVDTWNAESNDHMIAVNERLGYVVMDRQLTFQRRFGSRSA